MCIGCSSCESVCVCVCVCVRVYVRLRVCTLMYMSCIRSITRKFRQHSSISLNDVEVVKGTANSSRRNPCKGRQVHVEKRVLFVQANGWLFFFIQAH